MTVLAKCEAGPVPGSRYEVIGGIAAIELPLMNLDGKIKDGTAVLDMKDLSKFTCASTEPRNLSMWRDGLELVQKVRTEDGTETDKAKISKMDFFEERGFSIGLVVVPRDVGTALIFKVDAAMIPPVGVKASQTGSQKTAAALYIPSEMSLRVPTGNSMMGPVPID